MNSLFNHALKQSQQLKRDLEKFSTDPSSASLPLQGQISATLTSLQRTLDEYDGVARRELVQDKQDKAFARIRNFRAELATARAEYDGLRKAREEASVVANRMELLGRRPHASATPDNPYARDGIGGGGGGVGRYGAESSGTAYSSGTGISDSIPAAAIPREFFQRTGDQLDEFIAKGKSVLDDLVEQRGMLKGTQRRLYSAANTLGVSNETIKYIERRAMQDKAVFYIGVLVVVLAFYFIVRWFR
ncbi:uncharacterized protein V1516DRAFT_667746 [Lipomyces oligophaga]|uniref:uncharacterized protein n=1 Tax=Lipomyces oligophaga TaxID=45792 RepID=UPI0034CFF462